MTAVQKLCMHTPPLSYRPPFLRQPQHHEQHVDQFDEDKRSDQAAETVDQQVAGKQLAGGYLPVLDALEGQRNQGHDNQRVVNDGGDSTAL